MGSERSLKGGGGEHFTVPVPVPVAAALVLMEREGQKSQLQRCKR